MKSDYLAGALAAVALAMPGTSMAAPKSADNMVASAVADSRRPADDLAKDATRKGPEILAFSGLRPGWKVIDLMQGGGYYTRLFIAAAGPKGHVYAWSPDEFVAVKKELYGDSLEGLARTYGPQLTPLRTTFDDLVLPKDLDLVFTSQNYHDLHLKRFPADRADKLNHAVYDALKPGGVYLIVDHAGNAGDVTAPDRVHRMDPASIRAEVEKAGFKFDGADDALRNPADDHSKHVFDPSLRGHTDQIIYRFRKPKT